MISRLQRGIERLRAWQAKMPEKWQDLAALGLLAAIFWLARYWYSKRFGLYEDDLTIIPAAAQMGLGEMLAYLGRYVVTLAGHARPLSDSFITCFSYFGWKLSTPGEMNGLYWMGYAVQVLNLALMYGLLRRWLPPLYAALPVLGYVLFSADTTQAFLTHSLGVHPSITLLLLSLHLYLGRQWWLAYLPAGLILFSYETPFSLFLAAPLLLDRWDARWLRRATLHGLLAAAMLAGVFSLRQQLTDDRVGSGLPALVSGAVERMVDGPLVGLSSYGLRAAQALERAGEPGVQRFMLLGGVLVGLLVFGLPASAGPAKQDLSMAEVRRRLGRVAVMGLAMLALGYALALTTTPDILEGRGTRAHTAAGLGAGWVVGAAAAWLLTLPERWTGRLARLALTAACMPLLGYGFLVQYDYIHGWHLQQAFWTALVQQTPDLGPGVVVLVEPGLFEDSIQIEANTWNLPRVLNQIYQFPYAEADLPRVYRLRKHWDQQILPPDGSLSLSLETVYTPASLQQMVAPEQVIFIQNAQGQMQRSERLVFGEHSLMLKASSPAQEFPPGFLYRYLIISP